jgi:hypothetical protein
MDDETRDQAAAAALRHLRASGEPVREAFLYERVRSDGIGIGGRDFINVLMRLETQGHVHVDPVHDERSDPEPFAPRFWRVTE